MRSWSVCVILFLICSAGIASESRLPFDTVFKGQDQFNRLVAKAKSENWKSLPIGDRTAAVGKALVGTRYKHFTLEIDNRIESPSVNFYGMDCWTFFETALGFARMLNEPESNWTPERLLHYIEMDRYRGGECTGDYLSRLHYLEDWLYDNDHRGLVSRHDASAWRAQRAAFCARNDRRLAALSLSCFESLVARASCANGSECVLAAALRNSKKSGRQHRAEIAQRRRHWRDFARAKRAPFDCACGAGTTLERRRFAFHARFLAQQFRQSYRGRRAFEISLSVWVRQRDPRRAAAALGFIEPLQFAEQRL